MKYFLDTEFLEGTQKTLFGNTKPTIDLISIGLVAEDGREYYAISKDFSLKEAWNRYDIKVEKTYGDLRNKLPEGIKYKVYWIRENVLKPIWVELRAKEVVEYNKAQIVNVCLDFPTYAFTYKSLNRLIKKYGKTNKQIAEEIKEFCKPSRQYEIIQPTTVKYTEIQNPEFYGYYSDYDWVVFCWLFGRMIDLPKGFPMYCIDLKQELDKNIIVSKELLEYCEAHKESHNRYPTKNELEYIFYDGNLSKYKNYPKQNNEHNALADAKWNFELYKFLQTL